MDQPESNNQTNPAPRNDDPAPPAPLSKSARKKQLKQERLERRKAERKAAEKERKRKDLERRRREWDEKLAGASPEDRSRLIEARTEARKERMARRSEEREMKVGRLRRAAEVGQKVVVDLEFADLMTPSEIHSLIQQIMYCYAVNGRCTSPAHLWLTGCSGEIENQLQRIPGYAKWIIQKENRSYIEALQDQKDKLVYLTADADTFLDELDPKKIYIVGGLVDRNRWKGLTMNKAKEQGIQCAKLPIASCLKMSSSQVLTVNQVVEIILKYLETRDWKSAFFQVIPPRKRCESEYADKNTPEAEDDKFEMQAEEDEADSEDQEDEVESGERKKKRIGEPLSG